MNVDKMRHQLDRTSAEVDANAREQWLAAMTPEHRTIHERPNLPDVKWGVASPCDECVNGWMQLAGSEPTA